ncbi:hypothetical protein [Neptunicoccus cionae]|uniref:Uncharacterized protein n=1 Tax=Neptunicoccus cionae TaxID=2035344 RepID=A0A916R2E3_9RHOB|nr:hypothetical protein [Amylibacter cionae]GGA28790.1 hypothetical protein GCM10011498_32420 [Amylibacter cionae]
MTKGYPVLRSLRIGLCLSLGLASMAESRQRIPLSAAIAQCDTQSLRYSRKIADGGANTPSREKLNRQYRTCVYAKSGHYPPQPKVAPGLRISGTARLGIVVRD